MRAKARRMLLLVLLIAGSQAAYPQNSFPQNLSKSTDYWESLLSFPDNSQQDELNRKWNSMSNQRLSTQESRSLGSILSLTNHQISKLQNEEKQFLFKYQHLAIYLSGLNPAATNAFDRAGIWMLTYPDARRYGLVVNELIDERRDIVKSTRAASTLFRDLKKRHGVDTEAIFVLGASGWERSSEGTIDSVEENLATLRLISKTYQGDENFITKEQWLPQIFEGEVSVDVLTMELELDKPKFRLMNPTLIGQRIPGGTRIMVPTVVDGHRLVSATKSMEIIQKKKIDSIVNRIKQNIPSPLTHKVITYRVKSGDVLGRIAEHYDVRVSKIKKWNNLRSDRIDIHQKLTIYYPKGKKVPTKVVAEKTPKPEVKLIAEEVGKFTIYEVQEGDTLWAICKKFSDVQPEDIMSWNHIGENLSIGQKLKIKTLN